MAWCDHLTCVGTIPLPAFIFICLFLSLCLCPCCIYCLCDSKGRIADCEEGRNADEGGLSGQARGQAAAFEIDSVGQRYTVNTNWTADLHPREVRIEEPPRYSLKSDEIESPPPPYLKAVNLIEAPPQYDPYRLIFSFN